MKGLLTEYVNTEIKSCHHCYNYTNKSFIVHYKYFWLLLVIGEVSVLL